METVQISRAEYERLKEMGRVDWELVERLKRSFEDIRHGRVTELTPKSSSQ